MKRIQISLLLFLAGPLFTLQAQTPPATPENPGSSMTFRDLVVRVSEKDNPEAEDYLMLAQGTAQVGQFMMQQGSPIPESAIRDGIDAVDTGRQLNENAADWNSLQEQLEKLLEQSQNQQSQQGQGDQDQQQQEQQNQNQESQQNDQGDSQNQDQQQQEQQDGSQQEQQEQGDGQQQSQDGSDQQGDDSQQQSDSQQNGEQKEGEQQNQAKQDKESTRMGELSDEQLQNLQLSQGEGQGEENPQDMQTVGGQEGTPEKMDAERAALMQMLYQLKQQDDPSRLNQLLQEAQGIQPKQQPNEKDW